MKSIKLCSALMLLLAFAVGCEKESLESPEVQLAKDQEPKSLYDFVHSGVDMESYINKVKEIEGKSASTNKSHSTSSSLNYGVGFFKSFCSNLKPVEGFELGRMRPENAGIFTGPLDFIANVGKFLPGEILEGLSISTISESGEKPILGLYGQKVRYSYSKVIYAQTARHDLLIEFNPDVQSVSLDILSFPYEEEEGSAGTEPTPDPIPAASQKVSIEVTYTSGVVYTEVVTASFEGLFWGTTGKETISQIVLSSTNDDAWVGVDNIAFGLCEDNDGDRCLNALDIYPNSNLEPTIHVGGCDSGVVNKMTSVCGVSLSDKFDDIEDNTYDNHGQLRSALTSLANDLVKEELITVQEKVALMGCFGI